MAGAGNRADAAERSSSPTGGWEYHPFAGDSRPRGAAAIGSPIGARAASVRRVDAGPDLLHFLAIVASMLLIVESSIATTVFAVDRDSTRSTDSWLSGGMMTITTAVPASRALPISWRKRDLSSWSANFATAAPATAPRATVARMGAANKPTTIPIATPQPAPWRARWFPVSTTVGFPSASLLTSNASRTSNSFLRSRSARNTQSWRAVSRSGYPAIMIRWCFSLMIAIVAPAVAAHTWAKVLETGGLMP